MVINASSKRRGGAYPRTARRLKVGRGRPPRHTRFEKGRSGTPGGRSTKRLPALPADALKIDGRRRKLTKREAIVTRWSTNRRVRSARDQDADRHDKRRRAEGWRRSP